MEYAEFLLGWLSGIISSVIAQIIGHYLSKKNLKAQQEHSERILRMQLYREDKKKALIKLDELLKKPYKTFRDFKNAIESFLDGSSAIFLTDKLRKELKNEVSSISAFIYSKEKEFGLIPDYPDDYEDWIEELDPLQELDEEIKSRLRNLKSSMRSKIRKHVSEE